MINASPHAAVWHAENLKRIKELRRMRLLAAGLLALMMVFFVATSILVSAYAWLAYPRAFFEAAMVGACADWFAVVALFRHPLGIPIPHTAVVPKHKQLIGESLGRFISNNFLAPAELTVRMERVDAAGWVAHWLKEPGNAKLLALRLQSLFPPLLDLLNEEQLHNFSRKMLRNGIDSIAAAPLFARILSVLVKHGQHDKVFDLTAEKLQIFFNEHKGRIQRRLGRNNDSWLPGWVNNRLADAFLSEVLETMAAARNNRDHPWQIEYRAMINRLVAQLADDPDLFEKCERVKAEVLDNTVVDGYLDWLGQEFEAKLKVEMTDKDGLLSGGLEHALLSLANWLTHDTGTCKMVNQWAQQLIMTTVVPNRTEISAFVADVVARWDTATLVEKLELQVGKDLQYIRINGTLVGGLVGLVIFSVVKMFGVA